MKRFLVMITSEATEENKNFKGQECTYYYGKNQRLLGCTGSHAKATYTEQELLPYSIIEHGYKTEADAKRSWMYKNTPKYEVHWKNEAEIIAVEV